MEDSYKGIVLLLKSAVTGECYDLPECFSLDQAAPFVKKHNILTLVYEGAFNCGMSTQEPVMRRMFATYCKAVLVSEGQMKAVEQIYDAFDRAEIDYMPLKGCRMKHLYPRHELRSMGDADILIRVEQYDQIRRIMQTMGFEEKAETDHEFVWRSPDLYLELHKRLIPSYTKDFCAYYGDGWKFAKRQEKNRYSMTEEDEWIYLFTHFAKHYRDGGIGCRHVLDLWVWLRTHPDMDEAYIRNSVAQLQLDTFYDHILRLLKYWFDDGPSDDVLEIITEFIFSSGSFGKDEIRVLSRAVRDANHSALGFNGRLMYLWQTAFPNVETLRDKYRILKKAPWLLPVVWIVRPFYKVICETPSIRREKEHLDALSKENMKLRRKMLNCVGLDYHF